MLKISAQTRRASECGVVVDVSGVLQVRVYTQLRKVGEAQLCPCSAVEWDLPFEP